MPYQIIRNDITKIKADAIVNTANRNVSVGTGVDTAIYNAAGKDQLLRARAKFGVMKPGDAFATGAFNLNAKYIIHVYGIRWNGGTNNEEQILYDCYENALKIAKQKRCKSIAFPLLCTGNFGFPKKLGLDIALSAFTKFLTKHNMNIILVVFDEETFGITTQMIEEVSAYIDEQYAKNAMIEEYKENEPRKYDKPFINTDCGMTAVLDIQTSDAADNETPFTRENMSGHHMDEEPKDASKKALAKTVNRFGEKEIWKVVKSDVRAPYVDSIKTEDDLVNMVGKLSQKSFSRYLQNLIIQNGYTNSAIYLSARISKQYFAKIISGKAHPSKDMVIAIAFALQLTYDETKELLREAGYALSDINPVDLVIGFYIKKQEYNAVIVDQMLYSLKLPLVFNSFSLKEDA